MVIEHVRGPVSLRVYKKNVSSIVVKFDDGEEMLYEGPAFVTCRSEVEEGHKPRLEWNIRWTERNSE